MTFYAHWNPHHFTVRFNENGGSGSMENQSFTYGTAQNLTANAFTRTGYKFCGWATSSGGAKVYDDGQSVYNLTATDGATVDLYAVWARDLTFHFNANEGTGSMSDQMFVYGESKALTANTFTLTNYRFIGWSTSAGGSKVYNDGQIFTYSTPTDEGTRNLYAVWSRSVFNVTVTNPDPTKMTLSVTGGGSTYTEVEGVVSFTANAGVPYTVSFVYTASIVSSIKEVLTVNGVSFAKSDGTHRSAVVTPALGGEATQAWAITYRTVTATPSGTIAEIPQPQIVLAFTNDTTSGTLTATAPDAVGASFVDWSSVPSSVIPLESKEDNPVSFSISGDTTLTAAYGMDELTVGVEVDQASLDAGCQAGWVSVSNKSVPASAEYYYGQVATYSVTIPVGSQFVFAGWYANASDVTPASKLTSFDVRVVGNTKYYAKFAAAVTIRKSLESPSLSATLELDGYTADGYREESFIGDHGTNTFVLGSTLTFSVTPYAGGNFGGWFLTSDTQFATPLEYLESNTIVVTAAMDITARVLSTALDYYVAFYNVNNTTGAVVDSLGIIVPGSGTVLTKAEYESGSGQTVLSDGGVFRKYHGVQTVQVRVAQNGQLPFVRITSQRTTQGAIETIVSREQVANIVVVSGLIVKAKWGTVTDYVINATYENLGEISKGTLTHGNDVKSISSDGVTVAGTYEDGTTFGVIATPKNGYKFVGWYSSNPSALVSTDAHYTDTVTGAQTFIAHFAQDANSICKWEGSSSNKKLKWASKTYVSSRPFNPSAIRVDTDGYPVDSMKVEMFSSPDTAPTAVCELTNLASQNVRRLPVRRPEKYLRLSAESTHEVDNVVVGTSSGGLAV